MAKYIFATIVEPFYEQTRVNPEWVAVEGFGGKLMSV